eukprot:2206423-Amphidinium_carterae.2
MASVASASNAGEGCAMADSAVRIVLVFLPASNACLRRVPGILQVSFLLLTLSTLLEIWLECQTQSESSHTPPQDVDAYIALQLEL